MFHDTLTCAEVRQIDRLAMQQFHLPGIVLMENAGRGVADWMEELGIGGRVVILAGAGNNGGDGFVVARHLEARGHHVTVILLAPVVKLKGDARINYEVLRAAHTPLIEVADPIESRGILSIQLGRAVWIVDAMLGTGATGDPRSTFAEAIRLSNETTARRLAIDLPSGLDADTGNPGCPTFMADYTATFVAYKPGFLAEAARPYLGVVKVFDIGIPRCLKETARQMARSTHLPKDDGTR